MAEYREGEFNEEFDEFEDEGSYAGSDDDEELIILDDDEEEQDDHTDSASKSHSEISSGKGTSSHPAPKPVNPLLRSRQGECKTELTEKTRKKLLAYIKSAKRANQKPQKLEVAKRMKQAVKGNLSQFSKQPMMKNSMPKQLEKDLPPFRFKGNQEVRFKGNQEARFKGNQEARFKGSQEVRFKGSPEVRLKGSQEARLKVNQGNEEFRPKENQEFQPKENQVECPTNEGRRHVACMCQMPNSPTPIPAVLENHMYASHARWQRQVRVFINSKPEELPPFFKDKLLRSPDVPLNEYLDKWYVPGPYMNPQDLWKYQLSALTVPEGFSFNNAGPTET